MGGGAQYQLLTTASLPKSCPLKRIGRIVYVFLVLVIRRLSKIYGNGPLEPTLGYKPKTFRVQACGTFSATRLTSCCNCSPCTCIPLLAWSIVSKPYPFRVELECGSCNTVSCCDCNLYRFCTWSNRNLCPKPHALNRQKPQAQDPTSEAQL